MEDSCLGRNFGHERPLLLCFLGHIGELDHGKAGGGWLRAAAIVVH